jgi:hypothetical protein
MASFERKDTPETQRTVFYLHDDFSNRVELSPEQACDLLEWLYQQRDALYHLVHSQGSNWLAETSEDFANGFAETREIHTRTPEQEGNN